MTLMPVMSTTNYAEFIGGAVYDVPSAPSVLFSGIAINAGDILIAIVADGSGSTPEGPFGFSDLVDSGAAETAVKVFTKVAEGDEDTETNGVEGAMVGVAAIRSARATASASATLDDSDDPPSITNNFGALVFAVFASGQNEATSAAPSGYTSVGSGFNSSPNTFLHVAYKNFASANEDPGSFGSFTGTDRSVVTFSFAGS